MSEFCHSPPLPWRWSSPPLICRTLSCQLSYLSICPLIPTKTSGDGMPAESTTSNSKRTKLIHRPKLSLTPRTISLRHKAIVKPARKTSNRPNRNNRKRPHGKSNSRPTPATGPISQEQASRASKLGKKRIVAPRYVCFEILVAVAEGAQLNAAINVNAGLGDLDDRDRRFVQLLASTCLRRRGQLEKTIAPLMARRPWSTGKCQHHSVDGRGAVADFEYRGACCRS